MKPRVKFGLIAGLIGLVLNICVATLMGLCGSFVSLVAGGLAGFLTVGAEKPGNKEEGT